LVGLEVSRSIDEVGGCSAKAMRKEKLQILAD
jgi:hypothetical protein